MRPLHLGQSLHLPRRLGWIVTFASLLAFLAVQGERVAYCVGLDKTIHRSLVLLTERHMQQGVVVFVRHAPVQATPHQPNQ